MALDQLKAFLTDLQKNKELLNAIRVAATANEIAEIASEFGFQFSGDELKAASKENIAGVKIKKQDTSPSYSFIFCFSSRTSQPFFPLMQSIQLLEETS